MSEDILYKIHPNENTGITFSVTRDEKKLWLMKMDEDGIKFNRDDFPNLTADDFAKEFIYILEKNFNVSFYERIKNPILDEPAQGWVSIEE